MLPMFISQSSIEVRKKPQKNHPRIGERVNLPEAHKSQNQQALSLALTLCLQLTPWHLQALSFFNSRVPASNFLKLSSEFLVSMCLR